MLGTDFCKGYITAISDFVQKLKETESEYFTKEDVVDLVREFFEETKNKVFSEK